jgi:hypothetical protein
MNQQAAMAAASVLSEPVEAAARSEQVTRDMRREASGFRGLTRGLMRANDALGRATPGTMGQMSTQMETAGLPSSFILAVTRSHVHAIEERQQGDDLLPGRVLKPWDRAGFQARRGNDRANAYRGVPADRQVLILFLPIEGRGRIMQAAARNAAAAGSPGFPHQMMVAKDAPSQRLIAHSARPVAPDQTSSSAENTCTTSSPSKRHPRRRRHRSHRLPNAYKSSRPGVPPVSSAMPNTQASGSKSSPNCDH